MIFSITSIGRLVVMPLWTSIGIFDSHLKCLRSLAGFGQKNTFLLLLGKSSLSTKSLILEHYLAMVLLFGIRLRKKWRVRWLFVLYGSWLTRNVLPGPVFGSKDYFNGLGIFFDTYANSRSRPIPYVMAMVGDGKKQYDHDFDGSNNEVGGCATEFRNSEHPTRVRIRYLKKELMVLICLIWHTAFQNLTYGVYRWNSMTKATIITVLASKWTMLSSQSTAISDSLLWQVKLHRLTISFLLILGRLRM